MEIQTVLKKRIDMRANAGSQENDIEACVADAGNVLQKEDDTICAANVLIGIIAYKLKVIYPVY